MEIEVPMFSVFKTILGYCIFILASPIITFFISKVFFFEGLLGTSVITSNVWSAIFAIIMLHIALGMYIYRAYFESDKVKPSVKTD